MKDRFRFRAWDTKAKMMDEVDGYNLYLADGELYDVYEGCSAHQSYMDKTRVSDQFVIMQCTGLRDSEGTLIYEGDVVEFTDSLGAGAEFCGKDQFDVRLAVDWHSTEACFDVFASCSPDEMTIIGNIHENPELLEAPHV